MFSGHYLRSAFNSGIIKSTLAILVIVNFLHCNVAFCFPTMVVISIIERNRLIFLQITCRNSNKYIFRYHFGVPKKIMRIMLGPAMKS